MKQNYTEPNINIRRVHNADIITSSENVVFGDQIENGTTDAPFRRNSDWDNFEN